MSDSPFFGLLLPGRFGGGFLVERDAGRVTGFFAGLRLARDLPPSCWTAAAMLPEIVAASTSSASAVLVRGSAVSPVESLRIKLAVSASCRVTESISRGVADATLKASTYRAASSTT